MINKYILELPNAGTGVTINTTKDQWSVTIPNYLVSKGKCNVRVVDAVMQNTRISGLYDPETNPVTDTYDEFRLIDLNDELYMPRIDSNISAFGYNSDLGFPSTLANFNTGIIRPYRIPQGVAGHANVPPIVSILDSFQLSNRGTYEFTTDRLPPIVELKRVCNNSTGATIPLTYPVEVNEQIPYFRCSVTLEITFHEDM
jgi:hypothetical protein